MVSLFVLVACTICLLDGDVGCYASADFEYWVLSDSMHGLSS